MKKATLVFSVLAIAALASAQSITLGFESYTGGVLYCNYEILAHASIIGSSAWQGEDNVTGACGGAVNSDIAGVSGSGRFVDVSNGTGKKANIKGVLYADDIYDSFHATYTGAQWFVATNLVPDSNPKKFGWYGLTSISGVIFGNNFGHLTSRIPGPDAAFNGTNAGKFTK